VFLSCILVADLEIDCDIELLRQNTITTHHDPSRFPTKKKARVRELRNLTICHSQKRMRPPLESSNRVAVVAWWHGGKVTDVSRDDVHIELQT
jgi:hypothetical protein